MRSYQQTKAFYLGGNYTKKHFDRYFTWHRYPKAFWYSLAITLLMIFVFAIPGFGWLVFVCVVLLSLVCTIFILRAKSIPTYRQYDEWLDMIENYFGGHSRDRFRREHSKTVPKSRCMRSFVLPDSDLCSRYCIEKLVCREEKDCKLRFSFVVFTFFYPTDRYVAVYTYRVNVLNQYEVVPEKYRAYSYAHIVEFKISTGRTSARLNNHVYSYRTERVSLHAIHGLIDIGAFSGFEPVGSNAELVPRISANLDPIIDYLNRIVHSKW